MADAEGGDPHLPQVRNRRGRAIGEYPLGDFGSVTPAGGAFGELYRRPLSATRSGPLHNAFSWPTKIDAEAISLFIATHTSPGATVLDPFGGSGSTGIAARLCDSPTPRMLRLAQDLELEPRWGPRQAVICELSPLGALLAEVMCHPPDPGVFEDAAGRLVASCERRLEWMYEARNPEGGHGELRYAVWSEVIATPCCGTEVTFWDAAVDLDPAAVRRSFACPVCGRATMVSACERVVTPLDDPITGETTVRRSRTLARIYGRSGRRVWSRAPTEADRELTERVGARAQSLAATAPRSAIGWGDLRRGGYHLGIERIHHLYTPRNLSAVAALWGGIGHGHPPELRDALRLLVLSYNAAHSTLLTRVVAKRGQRDLVVSGAQSGVLYVSGLPVEKNVFAGVRRKIRTFAEAFRLTRGSRSAVRVIRGSSTSLDIGTDSVDYVFTDPPFGGYIPYAEVNQVNEAWLGDFTDRTEEAIVSPAQGKDAAAYGRLLARVFGETARVLRPAGLATVVFHSSSSEVWDAFSRALATNGLVTERTSLLDRQQPTFKQASSGAPGNTVLLTRNRRASGHEAARDFAMAGGVRT